MSRPNLRKLQKLDIFLPYKIKRKCNLSLMTLDKIIIMQPHKKQHKIHSTNENKKC